MEVRKRFHEKLEELYLDLIRMGNLTIETVERTQVAFANLDQQLAGRIIEGDDDLDAYVARIDGNGIGLLARQAPVAIDLRTIIVIMRLSQHLERVGDLCVNISKAISNMGGYTPAPWIMDNIDEMFKRARNMIVQAMDSFKDRDEKLAEELSQMDDKVDRINRAFLTTYDKECEENELELVIRVVMVSRFLERIADHAVDIGEEVRYLVTGEFAD